MNFGWHYDEERIAEASARITAAGYQFAFGLDRPSLKGHWARQKARGKTRICAQDDELALHGHWREENNQARGTCVGQGWSRSIEDLQISRLVDKAIIGRKEILIAYEVMYGYMRKLRWGPTHEWGCQCRRCPDGLSGADAAEFGMLIGCLARANYAQAGIDLSAPHEELAIQWNNIGAPQVLIAAAGFHKVQSHRCRDWDEYADGIAAKQWGHVCLPSLFGYSQVIHDKDGCIISDSEGGHDTECCGIVVLPNHEDGFLFQQSWKGIKYPPVVQTIDGPMQMRPGSYCVRRSELERIRGGIELYTGDIPAGSSFR